MSPETVGILLGAKFRSGLLMGVLALAIGVLAGLVWRWREGRSAPVVGLLLAGAALAGLGAVFELVPHLWVGLVCLAVAGAVHRSFSRGSLLSLPVTVLGASFVVQATTVPVDAWVAWFSLVAVTLSAPAVSAADRYLERASLGPTLFLLSVIGVFFAVPDTEQALVVLGATLPVAALGWPFRLGSLGGAGSFALVGLVIWTVVQGGYGRPGSIIGSALCLGLLVIIPPIRVLAGRHDPFSDPLLFSQLALIVAFHFGLVFCASRVVAVPASPLRAGIFGAALLLAGGALWGGVEVKYLRRGGEEIRPPM